MRLLSLSCPGSIPQGVRAFRRDQGVELAHVSAHGAAEPRAAPTNQSDVAEDVGHGINSRRRSVPEGRGKRCPVTGHRGEPIFYPPAWSEACLTSPGLPICCYPTIETMPIAIMPTATSNANPHTPNIAAMIANFIARRPATQRR